MALYIGREAAGFYQWLAHNGVTEAVGLNPRFKPGREHFEENKAEGLFPIHAHVRDARQLLAFARKWEKERLVAIGHNERAEAYVNARGYPRAAKDPEIRTSRQLFIDIDVLGDGWNSKQQEGIERYLNTEVVDYYRDLGFLPPIITSSGKGWHAWSATPVVAIAETPDIAERHRWFARNLADDHRDALGDLEARVDTSVCDLRRVVKLPGTSKPGYDQPGRWPLNVQRQEDEALLDYLLAQPMDTATKTLEQRACSPAFGPRLISEPHGLPDLFTSMLRYDRRLNDLWHGRGKANGDASRSGYDFSLTRHLIANGYRDIDDLAAVLINRPSGAVRQAGKSEDYVRRTIANALMK